MDSNARTTHGRTKGMLFSALVLVFIGLVAGSASAQTGTISGTVTDSVSGLPIEGAKVFVRGESGSGHGSGHHSHMAYTDAAGFYVIDEVEVGEVTVKCAALGYEQVEMTAEIIEETPTTQNIELDPMAFGSVEGMVTETATGLPIAGAHVALGSVPESGGGGDGHSLVAVTGEDGMYLIDNVPAGEYEARAWAFGYLPVESVPLTVEDGVAATLDLTLDSMAFGDVEGLVTDSTTGDPVENALVMLGRTSGADGPGEHGMWGRPFAFTDENGFYRLEDVEAGAYTMTVTARGYLTADREIEILEDAVATENVALDPLVFGSVEGVVTAAADGEPVADALVVILPTWLHGVGNHGAWWVERSGENGFYRFDEVPAGEYRMKAYSRSFMPALTEIEVLEGETATVDFSLEPCSGPTSEVN